MGAPERDNSRAHVDIDIHLPLDSCPARGHFAALEQPDFPRIRYPVCFSNLYDMARLDGGYLLSHVFIIPRNQPRGICTDLQ